MEIQKSKYQTRTIREKCKRVDLRAVNSLRRTSCSVRPETRLTNAIQCTNEKSKTRQPFIKSIVVCPCFDFLYLRRPTNVGERKERERDLGRYLYQ